MTNFYAQVKANAKNKARNKKNTQPKQRSVVPEFDAADAHVVTVNGINVHQGTDMPTWVQNNARYHINLRDGDKDRVFHVTREGIPKVQYFFEGAGTDIVGVQPTGSERGGRSTKKDSETGEDVHTKRSFNDLPRDVQDFVRNYWDQILG